MKKNIRLLPTTILFLFIGLILSAATVSATITNADGSLVNEGDTLKPTALIKSDAAEGMEITYIIPAFDSEDKNPAGESTSAAFPMLLIISAAAATIVLRRTNNSTN